MHPAYSIIFFTTASGAGYGLMAMLAVFGVTGLIEPEPWSGGAGFVLASALVAFGLLASARHLGHPERAWRAFGQWRSSWLSREAVLAVATFPAALIFAYAWVVEGDVTGAWAIAGYATTVLAGATVASTAMIYASLKPIRAWNNGWVPPIYLILAVATGALVLQALLASFGEPRGAAGEVVLAALFTGWCLKAGYWRFLDGSAARSTPESATGLSGPVRLLDPPNTQENFVQREMGYRIARKHAAKLRYISVVATFALPFAFTLAALMNDGALGTVAAIAAVPVAGLGIIVERWLFFAEAKHTVMLYYGASGA
jgi:DMSO reductase anchor subunit